MSHLSQNCKISEEEDPNNSEIAQELAGKRN